MSVGMVSQNTVNAVNYTQNNPNYKEIKRQEFPTHTQITYETPATTGKKWGVGIASWFVNGLGQAINGQWLKGIAMFAAGAVLPTFIALKGKHLLGGLVGLGLNIFNTVDAVKNAKSKEKVNIPKKDYDLCMHA